MTCISYQPPQPTLLTSTDAIRPSAFGKVQLQLPSGKVMEPAQISRWLWHDDLLQELGNVASTAALVLELRDITILFHICRHPTDKPNRTSKRPKRIASSLHQSITSMGQFPTPQCLYGAVLHPGYSSASLLHAGPLPRSIMVPPPFRGLPGWRGEGRHGGGGAMYQMYSYSMRGGGTSRGKWFSFGSSTAYCCHVSRNERVVCLPR